MTLPADLFDDNVAYRIRVCLLFEENPTIGMYTGSKVYTCDGCDAPIWVDEAQVIPDLPPEYAAREQRGDLNICKYCMRLAQEMDPDGGEPVFLREKDKKVWDEIIEPWLEERVMKNYQDTLFKQLEAALEPYEAVTATVQYDFSNVGTLMLMDGLTVIESWHFDVQTYRVSMLRRNKRSGPRSDGVYWWKPTDPGDNEEANRFLEEWTATASAYVRSKAT